MTLRVHNKYISAHHAIHHSSSHSSSLIYSALYCQPKQHMITTPIVPPLKQVTQAACLSGGTMGVVIMCCFG
jgi:hypothetical protein